MKCNYKMIYIPKEHPFYCMSSNGRVNEHRLVMAEHLGRPLTSSEVVHHKDSNPINNNLDNLFLTNSHDHYIITQRDTLSRRIRKTKEYLDKARIQLDELEKLHQELLSKV